MKKTTHSCVCCGNAEFAQNSILWKGLIKEWGLTKDEAKYIDKQQGYVCTQCHVNLRSQTLAWAMMQLYGYDGLFTNFVRQKRLAVLEINEAGNLNELLKQLPGHTLANYPDVDIMHLPYADNTYDVVIHSDTLEHIADPVGALAECKRVLQPGGYLIYTIPLVVGRLSRGRSKLPPSYHGGDNEHKQDYLVHTEYGADMWTELFRAGFTRVELLSFDFPASIAIVGRKEGRAKSANRLHSLYRLVIPAKAGTQYK